METPDRIIGVALADSVPHPSGDGSHLVTMLIDDPAVLFPNSKPATSTAIADARSIVSEHEANQ